MPRLDANSPISCRRSRLISRVLNLVLCCLVALSWATAAWAGGLAYLPDRTRDDVLPGPRDVSVLTWQLPGGLLVADRLTEPGSNRFGPALTPAYPDAEWFLVQAKGHAHPAAETREILAALGRVHLEDGGAFVVEIPRDQLTSFDGEDLCRVRLNLQAPPRGWADYKPSSEPPQMDAAKDAALMQSFVDEFSQPWFFQTIQEISGNAIFWYDGALRSVSSRYYNTADKDLVIDHLAAKLTAWGYTVEWDNFTYSGHACRNLVVTKLGTMFPDEYVVLGGHFDSISPSPQTNAPGAEDNGSGTALVVEVARMASAHDFARSLQFVLFDAEEVGLIGSAHFVNEAVAQGRNIVGAVLTDMVAYYNNNYSVRIEGETPWEWLMTVMAGSVDTYTDIGKQKDYLSWGSDHVPFQQAGIPAFLAIDYDYGSYPGYHQTTDNWNLLSSTAAIGAQIGRACAATIAEVAMLQPDYVSAVDDLPGRGALHLSAAPNPFNPRVTFTVDLESAGSGELAVYDLSGRRVALLASGAFTSGANRFVWNGEDESGRALASGAYIGRLVVGGERSRVKVNLVR